MDREQRRFVTGGTATSGMSWGLIETRGNAWATFNFNRGQGAVGSAALHISAAKCGCIVRMERPARVHEIVGYALVSAQSYT